MTWPQFKNYLENKILQENEEEETYTLRPEVQTNYSPSSEPELVSVLTNLITSIDNIPYYSSSNSYSSLDEQNEEYYPLPELTDLVSAQGQIITWNKLFPKREDTHFGQKEDIEAEITSQTWKTLTQIFNDWTMQSTRSQRLKDALGEEQVMMKFLLEAAVSLNYDLIKRKGYDVQLKNWQAEYNQLGAEEQADLQKQKELVDKLLTALAEETSNRQQKEASTWYSNLPWKSVVWYGGGGLLVIIVLGWLWNKLKE